ncbi:hypothetical protein AALA78_03165 [Lachnospiraceae bacterium 42-17]
MKLFPSTKERFALSLLELLENNKFESISAGDVVKNSGLSNRTFYNHFCDKNDLLGYCYRMVVEPFWYSAGKKKTLLRHSLSAVRGICCRAEIIKPSAMRYPIMGKMTCARKLKTRV